MARILAVTSRLPFPPREGHQLRSWHLLKALARRHAVTLLSFVRKDDDPAAAGELRSMLAGLELFPIDSERSRAALGLALLRSLATSEPFVSAKYASEALRSRIAALTTGADIVHFDMLPLMRHADAVPEGTPIVYNAHNVEHALLGARVRMPARPGLEPALAKRFLARQLARLRAFERAACERASLVLACSDADAALIDALAPGTRVEVVANGVDLDGNRPAATQATDTGCRLVFVGQMGWFPNRDGIDWFLRDILPRILSARPRARFVLVGKAGELEVPAAVASQVTLAGFVDDLRPHVHGAAVYVVPLRVGSGTRLKVLEAMALGKAIVTTSIGSEGIALRDGESALYADDAGSFAAAVVTLLDSPADRQRLGAAARLVAERQYGWEGIGRDLVRHYDRLLVEAQPPHASASAGATSA